MSDVVLVSRQAVALPTASADLETWLWQDIDGARFGMELVATASITGTPSALSLSRVRAPVTPALVQEARRALAVYERAAEAPAADVVASWLQLLAVVRNPPEARAMPSIVRLFAAALSDYPVGAFTSATQRRAALTFKFWPSAADIAELIEPEAAAIRRGVKVLRYLSTLETGKGLRA